MNTVRAQFQKWATLRHKRPAFDFLTLHYLYIIGMTMLGSLLVRDEERLGRMTLTVSDLRWRKYTVYRRLVSFEQFMYASGTRSS